ncbi:SprT-like domain-containing protein [Micromonospora sp. WMMD980]|uniref:SprT-like domain-containing protein n=1 Tax=Micromonospora sp. WMMD980 TaxID=3016088 RepID=UPI0024166F4A|nr:SprT-like domain-containing protein [Micromonospora sp. WMMD980]MDG4801752.1 SprT-like domain-containing protein [Micromonospora sp. WMMD980]
MTTTYGTREEWLTAAVEAMRPLFAEVGETIPTVRVSVGWPGGKGKKNATIGQCWPTGLAGDKVAQIFISPVLDKPADILATLAHELVHAVDDCANQHKGRFVKIAKAIGLTGKMTATVAGDELAGRLAAIAKTLGDFPHGRLSLVSGSEKKQSTRMIKCECGDCGYTARTTRKWLDEYGAPICPCNKEPMGVA